MKEPKKILIAEDEMVIAMDLQASVERFGYEVTHHVTRGEDVIEKINANRPDIILMDIKLDGLLDGVQTAEIIYETFQIPVIFITSFSNNDVLERAKNTYPFGYIVKPFDDRELHTNIEIALHKHESELKLRESEKKYRQLSESIQQIIVECDLNGNILYINQPGLQLLGISHSEFERGICLTDYLQPESFERIKARLLSYSPKNSQSFNREYSLIVKCGKHFFIEEYLSPVILRDSITGFRGILFDITSKKLKEDLSELYNKLTFSYNEDSIDPMEIIDFILETFRYRFPYLEDISFYEYDDHSHSFIIHSNNGVHRKKYANGYAKHVIESGKALYLCRSEIPGFKSLHNIPDKEENAACWMGFINHFKKNSTGIFVLQSQGNENAMTRSDFDNLANFFSSVNSLFERLSYLKQIRKSESEYKHLVNSINEGLIQIDLHGNITFVNNQFCKISGYYHNELLGTNLFAVTQLPEEVKKKLKSEMRQRSRTGSVQYEIEVVTRDKQLKSLIVNASPFRNNEGKIVGSIATVIDMSEKKEYLRLVRESEQKFKAMFEQAAVGVAMINSLTGYLTSVNRKYTSIVGYSEEELLKMSFMQLTHPEDLKRDLKEMKRLLKGEIDEFTLEKRLFKKTGEIVWVNLTVSPLWAKGEVPSHHIAIIVDITERKKIEAGLRRSELEKGNILKSMPDSFLVLNSEGIIINSYFSRNEQILIPRHVSRISGLNVQSLFNEEMSAQFVGMIRNCLEISRVGFMEIQLEIEGVTNWFELRFSPMNAEFALMIIRNVTNEKNNLLQVQKFYNITEQTHELIMITDKFGYIQYVNPTFSQITGYQLSDVKGKTPAVFKSNKHSKKFYGELWGTIRSGKSFKGEFTNMKKNGEIFIEEKIISPLLDHERQIISFISTGRDVTEERRREKRLKTYQKFEKTLEKKEQKYRTLSLIQGQENERTRLAREIHDGLGQMLTVANANLENIDEEDIKPRDKRMKLEIVKEMVAEIIQESRRISHNLSPVGLQEFGLHIVLEQLVKRIKQHHEGGLITFESDISGMRFKPEVEINLYRIVQEGIQNSLKHAQAQNINLCIHFRDGQLKLLLNDDGKGANINQIRQNNNHFNGLKNLEERAKIINGNIRFFSESEKGFSIELIIKTKKISI